MTTRNRIFTIAVRLLLTLLFLFFAACSSENNGQNQVKATVMRYTDVLASCYKNMDMNPMQQVATPDHAAKLYSHMAALGEGRVRMESKLKKIGFEAVTFPKPGTAAATTKEMWDFVHVNIDNGQKSMEKKDFPYEVTYELKKEGGHWLVTNTVVSTALAEKR
jgi:hypothetical protein